MKQSVVTVCFMLMFYIPQPLPCQRLIPPGKDFQNDEDDYHPSYADDVDEEEYIAINNTGELILIYFCQSQIFSSTDSLS